MIIGVPKESKNHEYRIGLIPKNVEILAKNRHSVSIENGAGIGSGFSDDDFKKVNALIASNRFIWFGSDIIVKIKEPLLDELNIFLTSIDGRPSLRKNRAILAFFHFPANPRLKQFILEKEINVLPYENIQLADGSRPILKKMSEIAAEVSVDVAAHYLRRENGGKGKLLKDATALVGGCEGSLGKRAVKILIKKEAYVIGFDLEEKIQAVKNDICVRRCCSTENLNKFLPRADVVICAAASKGQGAPKLITREMLKLMQPGSVIIDPSIDEGGCCETSRPTTHDNPVYVEEGIIHYCVANMPGTVPRSSTPALAEETLPYILEIANKGWEKALAENPVLAQAAKIE